MKGEKPKNHLFFLLILVLVLVSVGFIIPKVLDLNRYKGLITSEIENGLQGKVSIGHITWGISDGIWLKTDKFSITEASGFPADLNLTNIYAKLAILPLFSKRIEIQELTLDGPGVVLKLKPEIDEIVIFDDKTPKDKGNESSGGVLPFDISVKKLSIQNGRIRIENGLVLPGSEVVYTFNALKIDVKDIIPGREIDFHLSLEGEGTTGLGVLRAQGSFKGLTQGFTIKNPKFKLTTLILSLNTDTFTPYLKTSRLGDKLGGNISLEMNYEGDLFRHYTVEGSVNLTGIRYQDPSLWEDVLPGKETIIRYQAAIDPDEIRLEDLEIRIGDSTVNANARIKNWHEHPVMQEIFVSSTLRPEGLVPLIPWRHLDKLADKIRPVLEAGGKIEIENFSMGKIALTEPFPDPVDFFPGLGLAANVSDISIPSMSGIPELKLVSGRLSLDHDIVDIEDLQIRVASANLPTISGKISNILESPHLQANVLGELSIPENLGDPGKRILNKAGIENITGRVYLDLNMEMESASPKDFQLEGNAELKKIQFKTVYSPALIEELNARIDINPDRIKIANLSTMVFIPETTETQSGRFSVKLNGRLNGWRKEPVVLIQDLSTSPISLNPIVSVIPWEQVGEKAYPLKEVLSAGGSLKINNCSLPGINLKKPPKNIKAVILKTTAAISISDIEIQPRPAFPKFDGISGNIAIDKGVLNISDALGRMGPVTFPSIRLQASGFNDDLQVTGSLKGPVKIIETDNKAIETFLMEKGFKSFTGAAEIDMNFKYIQKQPEDWVAKGSLMLDGLNAESHPKGAHLNNVKGRLFFSRAETTEVTVEELSGKINTSLVKLEGKLTGGRTPDMVIDGKAYIKELDLAEFNSLLPNLDYLKLAGKLDLDLDFKIPFANPTDTRIDGTLNADRMGFHLPDSNIVVKDTDIEMRFASDIVQLAKMDMTINDQLFHLEGKAFDPAEPKISLLVQSPNLDVDRLLPGDKEMAEPSRQQESDIPEKDTEKVLPPWAYNLTTDLRVNIDRGKFHDQPFTDLKLGAHYEKGILQNYDAALNLANGKIITTGSADLRNLKKITFTMNPDISNVRIGELSPLFEVEKMPLDGPLAIKGRLEGEAGDADVLLSSLNGTLKADVGQGQMSEAKYFGKITTDIFSFINLKGLFSGELTDKMENEGIPFTAMKFESTFSNGNMNLNDFIFISDSLNGNSQGIINFPDEKIALQVVLEPLQTINKGLGLVPFLGKLSQKFTEVHILVAGPLDDPEVRTIMTRGITNAIQGIFEIPDTIIFKESKELSDEIDAYIEEKEGENNNTK